MDITDFVVSHRDNALLIGDYRSYHAQLSRQLAACRKKLGRATKKNAKFEAKAPITAGDIGGNHEYFQSTRQTLGYTLT
jgi:signal recognition particle subunit SRP68